jgi:hypothetical protein
VNGLFKTSAGDLRWVVMIPGAASEKLRKSRIVNQMAISDKMTNGTVVTMACPMVITLVSTWMIPPAVRLGPRMEVKISIVDASK